MDSVDDRQPHFASLEDLGLPQEDTDLLAALTSRFREVRYFVLERGLSSAIKTVAKPKTLFPLLVKIDCREKVEAEAAGDTLLRDRVPPMSLPPLEAVRYGSTRGGIAYRYVTGGRVRDLARRFDTALLTLPTYRALQVIDDIFDVILKKCHWLDGQFEMRGVQLPAVSPSSDSADDPTWQRLRDAYERATNICHSLKAPHGIVHGDLHAKNVLLTRDDAPVLIDFARARKGQCQMLDFATFEAPLQFQVHQALATKYWEMEELQYGATPLIVPHSNSKLATCIHRLRSNLWQGCTRRAVRMPSEEVDLVYRGFLMHALLRLYLRTDNSAATRERAAAQAASLAQVFA